MLTYYINNKFQSIYDFINIISSLFHMYMTSMFQVFQSSQTKGIEEANVIAIRLMDTYGNTILRMAYTYLHNMSDAEEILQDTIMKYLNESPTINDEQHEKAWLLRVCANLCKNKLKYNKLRETDELNETLVGEETEDLSFVWEAIKSLPEIQREVIHLYYYEGYKISEISSILKRNESTIRSDLKRGRENLKEILKEEYDFS